MTSEYRTIFLRYISDEGRKARNEINKNFADNKNIKKYIRARTLLMHLKVENGYTYVKLKKEVNTKKRTWCV